MEYIFSNHPNIYAKQLADEIKDALGYDTTIHMNSEQVKIQFHVDLTDDESSRLERLVTNHVYDESKSDSLREYTRHILSMRKLTNVELINTYWNLAQSINETNRLAFIIRGNLQWESQSVDGIYSDHIWLKSNRHESIGRHISEEPVKRFLQSNMNLYEIWGTLDIDIDPNNATTSKQLIERAIDTASCINNTLSFLFGASLRWYPARYANVPHNPPSNPPEREIFESWDCIPLPRSQEEQTSTIIQDENIIKNLLPLVARIESLPKVVRPVIKRAIDWHAQANHYTSDLMRFVNYWASIELLGNYFYTHLKADKVLRKTRNEKKASIREQLSGITPNNCMNVISKCNDIRNPSARTRILAFLNIIADKDEMESKLFKSDSLTKKSLYKIRNDIAHGKISESDLEKSSSMRQRLFDARAISYHIISLSIENAQELDYENS